MKGRKVTREDVRTALQARAYPQPCPGWERAKRKGRGKAPLEADECEALHIQLRAWGLLHTHNANEHTDGRLIKSSARQGMRKGWPDFTVYHSDGRVLHIEMKRVYWANWSAMVEQLECIRDIRECGHVAEICWGAAHAVALVDVWRRL